MRVMRLMRLMRSLRALIVFAAVSACAAHAAAQEPPPRIPLVVVDLRANVPRFPESAQLAASRLLNPSELPGAGWGGDLGVHVYPLKWRAMTFGLGGQMTIARSRQVPDASTSLRAATGRFTSLAPQLSFNFGSGTGWSYLSGGVSVSTWSLVPDGSPALPADRERPKTINYGGGARWFIKPHLAFSFDVRFYAINPTVSSDLTRPGGPRTTLLIVGAGVSLK